MNVDPLSSENERLQDCIDGLAGLLRPPANPAVEPSGAAQHAMDALFALLDLDLAYLSASIGNDRIEVVKCSPQVGAHAHRIGALLEALPADASARLPFFGYELFAVRLPLGLDGGLGFLVAGTRRPGFPSKTEQAILGAAASRATIALQHALLAAMQEQIANIPRDKDAMLRQLVDSIAAEVTLSTPDGEIVVVNKTCLERTGRPSAGHSDWATSNLLHPDDLPRVKAEWARALAAEDQYRVEVRSLCADGVYRWVNSHGFPIREADGQIFRWCTLHLDIDDRKRAEEALKVSEQARAASERSLNQLISVMPGLVWSADPDGSAVFVNQRYLDYVGLPLERMLGWAYTAAIHPDDQARQMADWRRILASGQPGQTEARIRRFDGEYRWFLLRGSPVYDAAGKVTKWHGVNTDIEDQKRAEQILRASEASLVESEQSLRRIIDTIPAMAWTADPGGNVDFFNHNFLDYVGRSLDKMRDGGWKEAVHPDDVEHLLGTWVAVMRGCRTGEAEARLRRSDGVYRWFLMRVSPLCDAAGNVIRWYGVNTDIEDMKSAERRLEASERRLNQIIDTIPALVWSAREDGSADFVNQHFLDYVGLTMEEVKDWGFVSALHPDDRAGLVANWQKVRETGKLGENQARLRRADGEYRWFLFRGQPLVDEDGSIRWFGLNIDIEERKRIEEALLASERKLDAILHTMPAQAWSTNPDGTADFFNQHHLDYVGLSLEQMVGTGFVQQFHPDDLPRIMDVWTAMLESGRSGEVEGRIRRFDGEYRWFLFRATPVLDDTGKVVKWYGVNTDIDGQKRAEEELRDTQAELAHMTRVMTMGHLTASIAHELNQPLAGIITNASTCLRMLAADPPNVAGASETARRTIRDGNRAAEVIARLRALFKKGATATEAVDLNAATQEVIALTLTELQRASVNLRLKLADDLPPVNGDRVQLQQVIMNLILNAIEAMDGVTDRSKELVVATEREESDRVRVVVQDAGIGFDSTAAEKLFNPFYTTKGQGMGIGLSVSRSIVENHHGRLWAESNEGPGATFLVSIPSGSNAPAAHP